MVTTMTDDEHEHEAYRTVARVLQDAAAKRPGVEYEDFATAPVEAIVEAIKASGITREEVMAALRSKRNGAARGDLHGDDDGPPPMAA